jgi:hypothetical protein
VKEADFDELKQDLNSVRFDLVSDLKQFKIQLLKYTSMFHSGISMIGKKFYLEDKVNTETSQKYKIYEGVETSLRNEIKKNY